MARDSSFQLVLGLCLLGFTVSIIPVIYYVIEKKKKTGRMDKCMGCLDYLFEADMKNLFCFSKYTSSTNRRSKTLFIWNCHH